MRRSLLTMILLGLHAIPALSMGARAEDPMEMPPDLAPTPSSAPDQGAGAALPPASKSGALIFESRFSQIFPRQGADRWSLGASLQGIGRAALSEDVSLRDNLRMRTSKTQFQAFETDRNLRFASQELALTWQTQPTLNLDRECFG